MKTPKAKNLAEAIFIVERPEKSRVYKDVSNQSQAKNIQVEKLGIS